MRRRSATVPERSHEAWAPVWLTTTGVAIPSFTAAHLVTEPVHEETGAPPGSVVRMHDLAGTPSDQLPAVLAAGTTDAAFAFISLSAREPGGRDAEYLA